MQSFVLELKLMEEITFSVWLSKKKGSTLEEFIRKHWLAIQLLIGMTLKI